MILVIILISYLLHCKYQQSRRRILGRGTAQPQKTLSCPPCIIELTHVPLSPSKCFWTANTVYN